MTFSDGTRYTASELLAAPGLKGTIFDDVISGTVSADIIEGGRGTDRLIGGDGADTYIFNRGDGTDTIVENSYNSGFSINSGVRNRLILNGYEPDEVTVTLVGTSDVLLQLAGQDQILIEGQMGSGSTNGLVRISEVVFENGQTWRNYDGFAELLAQRRAPEADEVLPCDLDDVRQGGPGNDLLQGGRFSKTIIFNRGDGVDVLNQLTLPSQQRFEFRGYELADAKFNRLPDNPLQLVISFVGSDDRVILPTYFAGDRRGSDTFRFDDQILTQAQVLARIFGQISTDGNDIIIGTEYRETIEAGLGDDFIDTVRVRLRSARPFTEAKRSSSDRYRSSSGRENHSDDTRSTFVPRDTSTL